MSNISIIHDGIFTRLNAILPNHSELTDPYRVDETHNSPQLLQQGFGLRVLDANRGQRLVGCQFALQRDFTVVLTRRAVSLRSDQDTKKSSQKDILEDEFLVIQDFESSPKLGVSGNIVNTEYVSDSGIGFVNSDDFSFIKLEVIFRIEYFEDFS